MLWTMAILHLADYYRNGHHSGEELDFLLRELVVIYNAVTFRDISTPVCGNSFGLLSPVENI